MSKKPFLMQTIARSLYDTVRLDRTPIRQGYFFFSLTLGFTDSNKKTDYKQYLQTNQVIPGQLPAPQVFNAVRINALFLHRNVPLRIYETDLYSKTQIEFFLMDKTYWTGPAWMCASPFALFGTPETELPKLKTKYGIEWERCAGNLGVHSISEKGEQYLGVEIGRQENFGVRAHVYEDREYEDLDLVIHLDGALDRPIV